MLGGESKKRAQWQHESFLLQLRGRATVSAAGETLELGEGCCCIVPADTEYSAALPRGSRGLLLTNDPLGNVARWATANACAGCCGCG